MHVASAALSNQECLFADKNVTCVAHGSRYTQASMHAGKQPVHQLIVQQDSNAALAHKSPGIEHYISGVKALPSVYLVGSPGLPVQGPKVPVAIEQPVRCA